MPTATEPIVQIHNVEVSYKDRMVLDPEQGLLRKREELLKRASTERIVHGGEVYEVQADGSFEVPQSVATFMTRMPGWYLGPNPFTAEAEDSAAPKVRRV